MLEDHRDANRHPSPAARKPGLFLAFAACTVRELVMQRITQLQAVESHVGTAVSGGARIDDDSVSIPFAPGIAAALKELAGLEPQLAQTVDLKFFCGFTLSEIACMQLVSERTVRRRWEKARLLLSRAVSDA